MKCKGCDIEFVDDSPKKNKKYCNHKCMVKWNNANRGIRTDYKPRPRVSILDPALFKQRAHDAVRKIKHLRTSCEICGEYRTLSHGHHQDYEKRKEVNWLCQSCHERVHSAVKQILKIVA